MYSFKKNVSLPLARYKSLVEWSKTISKVVVEGAQKKDPKHLLAPGIVIWVPSPDNLIIQTEEAKNLFTQIKE